MDVQIHSISFDIVKHRHAKSLTLFISRKTASLNVKERTEYLFLVHWNTTN